MNDRKFWALYNAMMGADLNYEQKQVMYFGAKLRYMGCTREVKHPVIEKFKLWTRKNNLKGN